MHAFFVQGHHMYCLKPLPDLCLQTTASVTFLPLLSDPCTFDLLVYTDTSSDVPLEWCAHAPQQPSDGPAEPKPTPYPLPCACHVRGPCTIAAHSAGG